MKKKFFILLTTLIFTLGFGTTVFANSPKNIDVSESSDALYVSIDQDTLSIFGKSKTVTKNYPSVSSIPASIYYTEYIDDAWWGGTLKHQSTKYLSSSNLYQATFTGTIRRQ